MDLGIPALLTATIQGCETGSFDGRATVQAAHNETESNVGMLRIAA